MDAWRGWMDACMDLHGEGERMNGYGLAGRWTDGRMHACVDG